MEEQTEIRETPARRKRTGSQPGRKRDGPGGKILVLSAVLLVSALILFLAVFMGMRQPKKEGLAYEANVVAGDIPGKSKEERQRELDSIVEEGMLAMSINVTPSGRGFGKDRSINWLIENPSNQGKLIRVEVYRDDTGEKIYETGAIKPGNYVETAPPDVDLPIGEYDCTARFYTYRLETEEYIGQAAAKVKLVIYE